MNPINSIKNKVILAFLILSTLIIFAGLLFQASFFFDSYQSRNTLVPDKDKYDPVYVGKDYEKTYNSDNFIVRETLITESNDRSDIYPSNFNLNSRYQLQELEDKEFMCEWSPKEVRNYEWIESICFPESDNQEGYAVIKKESQSSEFQKYQILKNPYQDPTVLWEQDLQKEIGEPINAILTNDNNLIVAWSKSFSANAREDKTKNTEESIVINGRDVREVRNLQAAFNPFIVDNKIAYFARKADELVLIFDNREIPLKYDIIAHYGCCPDGLYNPIYTDRAIDVFAYQENLGWYHVQIGYLE
jgi:hypothetical protein